MIVVMGQSGGREDKGIEEFVFCESDRESQSLCLRHGSELDVVAPTPGASGAVEAWHDRDQQGKVERASFAKKFRGTCEGNDSNILAMARSKANKAPKGDRREPVHQPASPIREEVQEDSDVDVADADDQESDGSELEKDAAEEELEHLVFGDSAGFREGLRDFGLTEEEEFETEEGAGNDTTDLAGLDDAAVGQTMYFYSVATDVLTFFSSSLPILGTTKMRTNLLQRPMTRTTMMWRKCDSRQLGKTAMMSAC